MLGSDSSTTLDYRLEIEFGVTPRTWTDIPVDAGAARVISDGMNIYYDAENLLSNASQAAERVVHYINTG
ncbi:MAG: hypothetical protein ACR2P1_18780 [Pseudomonadales bacterium]